MTTLPYVIASAAASLDGCIDDATEQRLLLSNAEDFDRVDQVRASVDAILVGAGTVRADNPRLMVRSEARRAARAEAGKPETPAKVIITSSGIDPESKILTTEGEKIIYTSTSSRPKLDASLGDRAVVLDAGDPIDLQLVLADLAGRGIERLMVEGGSEIHHQFLAADAVDELHMVVAPFIIGSPDAPRFIRPATDYPQTPQRPLRLAEVRQIGEVVLLCYRKADS